MKKLKKFYLQSSVFILFSFLGINSVFCLPCNIVNNQGLDGKTVSPKIFASELRPTAFQGDRVLIGKTYDGVEFRVQVRASRRAIVPIQKLAGRFHITEKIKEDFVGSWYRYSVGSFLTYNEAKDLRNKLITENGVKDAFIVAFYKGIRLNKLSDLKELAPQTYPVKNTTVDENEIIYRVQILAVKYNKIDVEALKSKYGVQREIKEEVFHNWRKYTVGRFTSFNEAKELRAILIKRGISGAFVVIYRNGNRITINKRVKYTEAD